MKMILNDCYGGFGIAGPLKEWEDRKNAGLDPAADWGKWFKLEDYQNRTNPEAIAILEEYGAEACSGRYANLEIVEIPDTATDFEIDDYDGVETVSYVDGGKLYRA
jgi:hypothetical protein